MMSGLAATASMAVTRPLIPAGPMLRALKPASRSESRTARAGPAQTSTAGRTQRSLRMTVSPPVRKLERVAGGTQPRAQGFSEARASLLRQIHEARQAPLARQQTHAREKGLETGKPLLAL